MNIKKVIALLLLICVVIIPVSCGKNTKDVNTNPIDTVEGDKEDNKDNKPKPYINPLTGLETTKETLERLPFAVMINNHSQARPQAALDQAEVVFEILAEGGITRLMALYLEKQPVLTGPIRSARYYYAEKALEFNSIYVYAGASHEVVDDIEKLKVKSLSALKTGDKMFFRRTDRQVAYEHTLYANLEFARDLAQTKGFEGTSQNLQPFMYRGQSSPLEGSEAKSIEIQYHSNNLVSYQYVEKDGRYIRSINQKPHVDETSQNQIGTRNIIIQTASTVITVNGTLEIDLVSSGKGKYISDGRVIDITWKKDARNTKTYFYALDGKELAINPGNTWIQVVPQYVDVNIK
jgi:hypothetical protein